MRLLPCANPTALTAPRQCSYGRARARAPRRRRRRLPAALPAPRLRVDPAAGTAPPAPAAAADALRADGPGLRGRRRQRARQRSHASTAASRWASASSSPGASSTRTGGPCATRWSRSGRPTPPGATPTRATSTAPLDPNFTGAGRCLTDDDGRYRFVTIKPGAYPWQNHGNAWRPAHIHFSVFGRAVRERLVTQMYFPGDPLFAVDPIFQSVPRRGARERIVSPLRPRPDRARVGARLPLRHRARRRPRPTPLESGMTMSLLRTPSQTVGPFFHVRPLRRSGRASSWSSGSPARSGSRAASSTARARPCPTAGRDLAGRRRRAATTPASAGGAARPTTPATTPSRPSSPAPCGSRTGAPRRPTSACCASRAACSSRS